MEFLDEKEPANDVNPVENEEDDENDEIDPEFNDWVEDEEDKSQLRSLFDNHCFDSFQSLIDYDNKTYDFDLNHLVSKICTDQISFIKLVNFIRHFVNCHASISQSDISQLKDEILLKSFLSEENYMIPVLQDDSVLYSFEEHFTQFEDNEED